MLLLRRTALARSSLNLLIRSSIAATGINPLVNLQRRYISVEHLDKQKGNRERVVVLGSGWAGYSLAHDLNPHKYQIVVISPSRYI